MSSELEVLKQRIIELEVENAEIPDLRRKLSVSDAEIAELKRRNAEVLRANAEYNERRGTKVKKLEQKNAELEVRLAIVKQGSLMALQNDKEMIAEMKRANHHPYFDKMPCDNTGEKDLDASLIQKILTNSKISINTEKWP